MEVFVEIFFKVIKNDIYLNCKVYFFFSCFLGYSNIVDKYWKKI